MMRILFFILVMVLIKYNGYTQPGDFYEISRLPFTSDEHDEFSPAFYREGIVFTSNKRQGLIIARMTDEGENLFNIYYSEKRESGRWRSPDLLDKNLRSNYHDGPVSFNADGSTIFFTRNIPGRRGAKSTLGIFIAEYSNGDWANITPFPYNSNNYNLTHPSITADGRTLYFASDMPGGSGGMDIYVSFNQGGSWSPPANLGERINSSGDEVFPNINPGGRLYFSSNNHTEDELDLYYSFTRNGNWQDPVRLPVPFNSDADDFGFIADTGFGTGYFTSNREGTDNIYSFTSTSRCLQIATA
jgi:hypothetical protein